MLVQVGQSAPAFTAPVAFPGETAASPLQTVSLSEYAGRWLVFFWYLEHNEGGQEKNTDAY